jgi:hypothetical protein
MKRKSTSTAGLQRYMTSRHKKILQHAVQPLPVPLPIERVPLLHKSQETILLRIVHKVQVIDANTNQKRRLLLPVRFACSSRNSPRSKACHSGPRASATKLQRKRAAGQANIIWCVVSGTTHKGHRPLPGPWRFTTSTPEGRRSRRSCHTKILVLRGMGPSTTGTPKAGRAIYIGPGRRI